MLTKNIKVNLFMSIKEIKIIFNQLKYTHLLVDDIFCIF